MPHFSYMALTEWEKRQRKKQLFCDALCLRVHKTKRSSIVFSLCFRADTLLYMSKANYWATTIVATTGTVLGIEWVKVVRRYTASGTSHATGKQKRQKPRKWRNASSSDIIKHEC